MNSKVLLTGATGFVGRQVFEALLAHGREIRLVVRAGDQRKVDYTGRAESIVTTSDLFSETPAWWERTCKGIDLVIHVAWYAEPGKYLQSECNIDCLAGTLNLAKACVHSGVRRFVGVGTCVEYDLTLGYVSTQTPLNPNTPYAAAKAATFLALSRYLPSAGVEFAWCRLFYLYGEGEDERRLVPYLRSRLAAGQPAELTTGTQIRDFMDVRQAGQMIADAALSNHQGPINICSGTPITVRKLAEQIADEYGRRDLLHFGGRPDDIGDPPCVFGIKEGVNP